MSGSPEKDAPDQVEASAPAGGNRRLLAQQAFMRLWVGQTASLLGTQVSQLALPLTAVLALNATSQQVGLLSTMTQLPFLLLSLLVGALVDRMRRRRLMIYADVGRMVILTAVPTLFWLGGLQMSWLYVLGFLAGCGAVFFDVAAQAYLPRLVERKDLVAANSFLGSSQSVATIGGPAIGGLLVQWLSAPIAACAASVSYLVSLTSVASIRHEEQLPQTGRRGVGDTARQAWNGLRIVFRYEQLRSMAIIAAIFNFSFAGFQVTFVQYMPRTLRLTPSEIGIVMAALGPGFLVGALFAGWLPRRFGYGRTLFGTALLANLVMPVIAALGSWGILTVVILVVINLLFASFGTANTVTMLTIRQTITPDQLQGRVAASNRFVAQGISPIGALVGGALGALIGLRVSILVFTLGFCLALIPLICSSLVSLRQDLPEPFEGQGDLANV